LDKICSKVAVTKAIMVMVAEAWLFQYARAEPVMIEASAKGNVFGRAALSQIVKGEVFMASQK
jgi:hypothetical protein